MKPERAAGWADADLMQRAEGLDELDRNDKRRERKKRIADTAHALREKRPMLLRNTRRRGWIKSGLQNLGAEHGFQRCEIGRVRTGCLVLVEKARYICTPHSNRKHELVLSIKMGCTDTVPFPREPNTPF